MTQQFNIDLRKMPFSRRGSLACVYENRTANELEIVFALFENFGKSERSVNEIYPVDSDGRRMSYTVETLPYLLILQLDDGRRISVAFGGRNSLVFDLPAGIGLHMYFAGRMLNMVRRGKELLLSDSGPLMYYMLSAGGGRNIVWKSRDPIPHSPPRNQFELTVLASEQPSLYQFHFSQTEDEAISSSSFAMFLEQSRLEWESWIAPVPQVEAPYADNFYLGLYALYVNLLPAGGQLAYDGGCPSKANFYGIWPWDTCFQTLGYQHLDMKLAQDQMRLLLDNQLENGMLPDIIHHRAVKATCTKPPVEAWAVWRLFEVSRDKEFLKEVYPRIVNILNWWTRERDYDNDGVYQYNHYWDGGWDNSPVYDLGMPVEAPDLNAHLIVAMDRLSRIAAEIGLTHESDDWKRRSLELTDRLIEHSYDEEKGYFIAYKDSTHEYVDTLTLIHVLPIIIPELNSTIVTRLIGHLTDPKLFWGTYSLPTVAYSDERYSADYWRGPIWLNINFMIIEALLQHQYVEEARVLRDRTLQLVAAQRGLLENYDSATGKGQCAELFGWTTAVYVHLCIQQVKGEIA